MNYLTVENLSKSFGVKTLFAGISFTVNQGQKVALIAPNGAGKSTLFKIITGQERPESGVVAVNPHVRVGMLPQNPPLDESHAVMDAILDSDSPVLQAIRKYEKGLAHPEQPQLMEQAAQELDRLHAWDAEVKIRQILSQLQIDQLEQPVRLMSGGQRKRIALAKVLIDEPDFLLLDEPTNHLDLDMIDWLEEYLVQTKTTLFLITHDRYFLERVCDRIVELDAGQIYSYQGNYSLFLEQKAERQVSAERQLEAAQNLFRKELQWIRRQPKARGTKSRARVEAFDKISAQAHVDLAPVALEIEIPGRRLGKKILELKQVAKRFGDMPIVAPFSYAFQKGERLGIIGPNGVGKSTFLNLLAGQVLPDQGVVEQGETVSLGYYRQAGLALPEDQRVLQAIRDIADYIPVGPNRQLSAVQMLERFLFPPATHYHFIGTLSGGEKRRLYLLTILMANPNFLLLDEPTNDLDIVTVNVLEDFLAQFQGCLVVVSHDRYFMDKVVDHLLVFEGQGRILRYPGSYSDYRQDRQDQAKEAPVPKDKPAPPPRPKAPPKPGLSFKEQKELEQIEKDLEHLGAKLHTLGQQLSQPDLGFEERQQLSEAWSRASQSQEQKEERWLELQEKLDQG